MVSSNGVSFASDNSKQNKIQTKMTFKSGDIIHVYIIFDRKEYQKPDKPEESDQDSLKNREKTLTIFEKLQ